jgi:hypothetical protein
MIGRYFQCWGDFHGKRCENTRVILAEGTLPDAEREEARKREREK